MTVVSFVWDDVDEAVDTSSRLFFPHEIEPIGRRASFRLELTAGRIGAATVGLFEHGCEIKAVAHCDDNYNVALMLAGSMELAFTAPTHVAGESAAVVARPGAATRLRGWTSGGERLALLGIDAPVLESELRAMLGRDVRGGLDPDAELDLRGAVGVAWRQLAGVAIDSLGRRDALASNPLIAVPLSSAIMRGLLLAMNHRYRADLDSVHERIVPRLVQRAMTMIDERAHEPLTVSGIAAEVGCSVRALRYGFQSHVGTSPGKYLARVRMDRVHHELVWSSPQDVSVTEILYRWGVAHPGRFAQAYREEYGVSPSTTLRGR